MSSIMILFAAWSSFAHAAVMSLLGLKMPSDRVGFLIGSAVLVVIGLALSSGKAINTEASRSCVIVTK